MIKAENEKLWNELLKESHNEEILELAKRKDVKRLMQITEIMYLRLFEEFVSSEPDVLMDEGVPRFIARCRRFIRDRFIELHANSRANIQ